MGQKACLNPLKAPGTSWSPKGCEHPPLSSTPLRGSLPVHDMPWLRAGPPTSRTCCRLWGSEPRGGSKDSDMGQGKAGPLGPSTKAPFFGLVQISTQ